MTYICQHCRNTGTGWIESGNSVVCPKCFKFTLMDKARVRQENKKPDQGESFVDMMRDMFGFPK